MTKLTQREQEFMATFLNANGCGATTPGHLIDDNYSCQSMEDIQEMMSGLNKRQVTGFMSSLTKKGVLWVEERDKEVDLYWVSEEWLKELPSDLPFTPAIFDPTFKLKGQTMETFKIKSLTFTKHDLKVPTHPEFEMNKYIQKFLDLGIIPKSMVGGHVWQTYLIPRDLKQFTVEVPKDKTEDGKSKKWLVVWNEQQQLFAIYVRPTSHARLDKYKSLAMFNIKELEEASQNA